MSITIVPSESKLVDSAFNGGGVIQFLKAETGSNICGNLAVSNGSISVGYFLGSILGGVFSIEDGSLLAKLGYLNSRDDDISSIILNSGSIGLGVDSINKYALGGLNPTLGSDQLSAFSTRLGRLKPE